MMKQRNGVLAIVLAATLLAGCANNGAASKGDELSGVAPAPATSGATVPDGSTPGGASGPPVDPAPGAGGKPGAAAEQTLSGVISAGVEANCLVLNSPGGDHLLIIRDSAALAKAQVGAQVTVVGRVEPRMMTTCQQGTPFVVSQVTVR